MPQLRESLDLLKREIDKIRQYEGRVNFLTEMGIEGNSIVNFGCAGGIETFALMWFFNAAEVIGIDKDIDSAEELLVRVTDAVNIVHRELGDFEIVLGIDVKDATYDQLSAYSIDKKYLGWWENRVPEFLKARQFPVFKEFKLGIKDKKSSLSNESYDLTYCSNVLHQVAGQNERHGVLNAVKEMKRILTPGGVMVVFDSQDYSELFSEAKLDKCFSDEFHYVYKKTIS